MSAPAEPLCNPGSIDTGSVGGVKRQLPAQGRNELPDEIPVDVDLRMAAMPCGQRLRIAQRRVEKQQPVTVTVKRQDNRLHGTCLPTAQVLFVGEHRSSVAAEIGFKQPFIGEDAQVITLQSGKPTRNNQLPGAGPSLPFGILLPQVVFVGPRHGKRRRCGEEVVPGEPCGRVSRVANPGRMLPTGSPPRFECGDVVVYPDEIRSECALQTAGDLRVERDVDGPDLRMAVGAQLLQAPVFAEVAVTDVFEPNVGIPLLQSMADDGRRRDSVRIRMIENQNFHLASNGFMRQRKTPSAQKRCADGGEFCKKIGQTGCSAHTVRASANRRAMGSSS